MLDHGVEDALVGCALVEETQFRGRRLRLAERCARREPCRCKETQKLRFGPSGFQIFDYRRRVTCSFNGSQNIARRPALGVVVDHDIHTQPPAFSFATRFRPVAPASYQPRVRFTIFTTESMTGTSIRTPTTVASAAPELKPKRLIAAATANSKKLLAPISADGAAMQCASPEARFRRYASPELK